MKRCVQQIRNTRTFAFFTSVLTFIRYALRLLFLFMFSPPLAAILALLSLLVFIPVFNFPPRMQTCVKSRGCWAPLTQCESVQISLTGWTLIVQIEPRVSSTTDVGLHYLMAASSAGQV